LATTGQYGLSSADGFRPFDPGTQTGPTVVVPAAVLLRLFGPDPAVARLIVGLYAAVGAVAFALFARRLLGNWRLAALAVALLLIGNPVDQVHYLSLARQFLGETVGLGFFVLGAWLWLRAADQPSTWGWVGAGLAWGLAAVTKSQALLLLGFSLPLVMGLERLFIRRVSWGAYGVTLLTAVAVVGAWLGVQWALSGPVVFAENSRNLREGVTIHVLAIHPTNWARSVDVLVRTGWVLWGVGALVWAILTRPTGVGALDRLVGVAPVVAGALWFTFLTIGWERYAFYLVNLSWIWLAGWLGALWTRPSGLRGVYRAGVVAVIATLVAAGLRPQVLTWVNPPDSGYGAMRAHLQATLPDDAVVETWEWEMTLGPGPAYLFPPYSALNTFTVRYFREGNFRPQTDMMPARPRGAYVLVGKLGGWSGVYGAWIAGRAPIARYGDYALYDVRDIAVLTAAP
jgi:4-amino-4-deoxy-L-arabinose transferase-like glycosyltransferase